MIWKVELDKNAVKDLSRIDNAATKRILKYLNERIRTCEDPRKLGKALKNSSLWRYRVGDYRIICDIQDNILTVLVVLIKHRKEAYKSI